MRIFGFTNLRLSTAHRTVMDGERCRRRARAELADACRRNGSLRSARPARRVRPMLDWHDVDDASSNAHRTRAGRGAVRRLATSGRRCVR